VAKNNPDVRVVIKQLPILGPESKYAAKAATLAQQKNKFDSFDKQLMSQEKPLTIEKVNAVLRQSGLKEKDLTSQNDGIKRIILGG
jgi:protein-disulfide isomerase